jgi:hypothetical protein
MESGLHFHGQGVTRPYLIIHASSHIHGQTSPNIIHGEHFESTVNKRMRLTRSSIHCEEKCHTNPVQSLSSAQIMSATK